MTALRPLAWTLALLAFAVSPSTVAVWLACRRVGRPVWAVVGVRGA